MHSCSGMSMCQEEAASGYYRYLPYSLLWWLVRNMYYNCTNIILPEQTIAN